jgi:hypothetical protein
LNTDLKDRFHKFANSTGWDNFEFSIIELCDLNNQEDRENFYLQKYLPLLNTVFKSNFGQIQSYYSLYELLRLRKLKLNLDEKYKGINLYLYEYIDGQVSDNYQTFSSINELSTMLGIARETNQRLVCI